MTNEAQIETLIENWALAVRKRDMDGILAHHAPDIVMYDVPPPFQSIGIAAYRQTWETFFDFTEPGIFNIEKLYIKTNENIAFCYATMECSDKSDTGEFVDLPFRLTIGLEKTNGQWLIIHEHHSIPAK